jgi:hypothetical protein
VINMTKKYQKFGFRRDKNLSDAPNPREALANIIDNLATAPGTSIIPEDLYAIKGIQNTRVNADSLRFLAGITQSITQDNTDLTVFPLVTLKDRLDNFKVYTGSRIFGPGGDGAKATFIPSNLISENISAESTGSELFTTGAGIVAGVDFWDDGRFVFDDTIHPSFSDIYGMVQWEGYYSPNLYAVTQNRFIITTTGLVLIESNISINEDENEWVTHHALVSNTVEITFTGDGNPVSSIVTDKANQLAAGMKIPSTEVIITEIDPVTNTITLSESIATITGDNTVSFEFEIGDSPVNFLVDLPSSIINDKIKIRYTVWWPDNANLMPSKGITFVRTGFTDNFSFNFHYSNYDRLQIPNEPLSIEYFLANRFGTTRESTTGNIISQQSASFIYTPPSTLSSVILHNSKVSGTFYGSGKIEAANRFTNADVGDWILIRNTGEDPRAYQIQYKQSNSVVFTDLPANVSLGAATPYNFSFSIVKNKGLIGIYFVSSGGIVSLPGLPFLIRRILKDQLALFIDSSSDFYRITSYEQFAAGRPATFKTLAGATYNPSNGVIVIYSDRGLVDQSKRAFCEGVVGATIAAEVDINQTTISLTGVDFSELSTGMYVQLSGYVSNTATIQSIDAVNSQITITPSNSVTKIIPADFSITFSPDSVNREICTLPNPSNTIPPFEGSISGITTSATNPGLWCNGFEFKNLEINLTDTNDIAGVTVSDTTFTKRYPIKFGTSTFKLIAK